MNSFKLIITTSLLTLFILTACGGSTNKGITTPNSTPNSTVDIDFISVISFIERTISNDTIKLSEAYRAAKIFTSAKECEIGTVVVTKDEEIAGSKIFVAEYSDFYGPLSFSSAGDCNLENIPLSSYAHGRLNYTYKNDLSHFIHDIIFGNSEYRTEDSEPYFSGGGTTYAYQGRVYSDSYYDNHVKVIHLKAGYLKFYFAHVKRPSEPETQRVDRSKFKKFVPGQDVFSNVDITKADNHYKGSYSKDFFILNRKDAPYLSENEEDYIKGSLKLDFDFNYYHRYGKGRVNYELQYKTDVGTTETIPGYIDYNGSKKTVYTTKNGIIKREYGTRVY